ncbi:uncharacterized protein CYBJADRAFT_167764 [Cyberlindnera jadinii NRRL Y-1542]|uniref:Altered inheritance of mitochondria protein 6 n=1 Tax=Cyberlindnera jadinii (strain ATCC 18201 / CBS 1600 / BCRC 20928 / JCM 3617 / NBRC 0987 / NRRL Y-1542) TaxID=983966 RepID=A0A1E4S2K4_CYBJN|nr:hypothetical protein CYBJADRAFT_167764 [Cyberlindnera jadinii NRRL Y-1542]ODV73756.1 hypothetical protein CYBJADRAFT_167764 [Cyberlindnera jadinii NRRL Y-1542]
MTNTSSQGTLSKAKASAMMRSTKFMLALVSVVTLTYFTTTKLLISTVSRPQLNNSLLKRDYSYVAQEKPRLPIHSHNDENRDDPVYDALLIGAASIESDVWSLDPSDDTLLVGHDAWVLTKERNLKDMYVDPLLQILDEVNQDLQDGEHPNGFYPSDPGSTLFWQIDAKNEPVRVFNKLQKVLESFQKKGYLTTFNTETGEWYYGPLTIVMTGALPITFPVEQIAGLKVRNVFVDAPLDDLSALQARLDYYGNTEKLNTIAITSSSSFSKITGTELELVKLGGLSDIERERIRLAFEKAHNEGILTRIWSTPGSPDSHRNAIWEDLLDLGIDLLNVDDLLPAAHLLYSRSNF